MSSGSSRSQSLSLSPSPSPSPPEVVQWMANNENNDSGDITTSGGSDENEEIIEPVSIFDTAANNVAEGGSFSASSLEMWKAVSFTESRNNNNDNNLVRENVNKDNDRVDTNNNTTSLYADNTSNNNNNYNNEETKVGMKKYGQSDNVISRDSNVRFGGPAVTKYHPTSAATTAEVLTTAIGAAAGSGEESLSGQQNNAASDTSNKSRDCSFDSTWSKTRKKKPKGMPKRPLTAFHMYLQLRKDQHEQLQQNNDDNNKNDNCDNNNNDNNNNNNNNKQEQRIGFEQLEELVEKDWLALPQAERDRYEKLATKDRERYKKEMCQYKGSKHKEDSSDDAQHQGKKRSRLNESEWTKGTSQSSSTSKPMQQLQQQDSITKNSDNNKTAWLRPQSEETNPNASSTMDQSRSNNIYSPASISGSNKRQLLYDPNRASYPPIPDPLPVPPSMIGESTHSTIQQQQQINNPPNPPMYHHSPTSYAGTTTRLHHSSGERSSYHHTSPEDKLPDVPLPTMPNMSYPSLSSSYPNHQDYQHYYNHHHHPQYHHIPTTAQSGYGSYPRIPSSAGTAHATASTNSNTNITNPTNPSISHYSQHPLPSNPTLLPNGDMPIPNGMEVSIQDRHGRDRKYQVRYSMFTMSRDMANTLAESLQNPQQVPPPSSSSSSSTHPPRQPQKG